MATPATRFQGWIDSLATAWSPRLGKWFGTFIASGFDSFFKILGKSFAPKLAPLLQKLTATGKIPPELQPLFDELLNPSGEIAAC